MQILLVNNSIGLTLPRGSHEPSMDHTRRKVIAMRRARLKSMHAYLQVDAHGKARELIASQTKLNGKTHRISIQGMWSMQCDSLCQRRTHVIDSHKCARVLNMQE